MDTFLVLLLWFLLSITSLFFLSQAKKRWSAGSGRLPPGPTPLPIIGNLHLLGDQPHRSLTNLSKTYGPIMTLRLGTVNTIIVSTPEAAREVLQKHDAIFCCRAFPDSIHNKSALVFSDPTHRWRTFQHLCNTELFSPKRLDAIQDMRRQKVQEMVHYIAELSSRGESVEIGGLAFITIFNLLSRMIFGTDLVGFDSDSTHELKELIEKIVVVLACPNVSDFFPPIAWLDLQGVRRRSAKLYGQFHGILEEQIERRRTQGKNSSSEDFLDILLECQRGDPDTYDRNALLILLSDLFILGSDTSSNTVEWAMAELLRNPNVMEKAKEEVVRVIGLGRDVEEEDMNQLPYLRAVVKETLHIHPVAPYLSPRRAESTVEILGYVVLKDAPVLVIIWAIGMDFNVWNDPNEFRPERLLDKEKDFRDQDFEFIPFGNGRRICPGLPLAVRMVPLMLASLLHRFEWKLPHGMEAKDIDVSEKFGITLAMAHPLQAEAVVIY